MPSISVPLIAAGIGATATVASSVIGAGAAHSAAQTQANAANQAAATQMAMYQQTRGDLKPYMDAGGGALSQLANIFGFGPGGTGTPNAAAATSQLTQFPGYQFGLDQGTQALDRSAASKGLLLSGAQLKDAQTFGQNYAMANAWQPYVNELNSVGSLGENAAAGAGNIGQATGAGIAQSQLAAGQATAAGQVGSANQLTSGIAGLGGQISNLLSSYGGVGGASGGAAADPYAAFGGSVSGLEGLY